MPAQEWHVAAARSRLTKPGSSSGRYRPKLTAKLVMVIGPGTMYGATLLRP